MIRVLGEMWALPWSLVGWTAALALGCDRRVDDGVVYYPVPSDSDAWAAWRRRFGFSAITIGTVTLCEQSPYLVLLRHEARHQRQARILGPFYVPVYLIGLVVGWARGRWYRRNPLEEDARGE